MLWSIRVRRRTRNFLLSKRRGVIGARLSRCYGAGTGSPRGEPPRVADSSAAGAGRFFHNRLTPSASVSYLYRPLPL